jgi:hypothetical protein
VAKSHEVLSVLSGFPRKLTWANFRVVARSPSPPLQALTSSSYHMGSWRVALEGAAYHVRDFHITVSLAAVSWATQAAKTNASLLIHEQGHYDITGLIARDLARNLLDLELDAAVVAASKDAGVNQAQHLHFAQKELQKSVDEYGRQAAGLLAKLQSNPATRTDGIYDQQTNHGLNQTSQNSWNNRLAHVKQANESFRLSLAMAGVL